MTPTLEEFNADHKKFVDKTFPEITDFRGPLRHLKEEVDETIESGELEEFADMLMLLLSAFRLRFPELDPKDLLYAAYGKLEICKRRKWKMNSEGFANHITE